MKNHVETKLWGSVPEWYTPIMIKKSPDTIVKALALGGDARLYHLLKEVKEVRQNDPNGPYKRTLREKGIVI